MNIRNLKYMDFENVNEHIYLLIFLQYRNVQENCKLQELRYEPHNESRYREVFKMQYRNENGFWTFSYLFSVTTRTKKIT